MLCHACIYIGIKEESGGSKYVKEEPKGFKKDPLKFAENVRLEEFEGISIKEGKLPVDHQSRKSDY